jgi:NAD+ synthase (glutamine-hydrolysing)
MKLKVTMAQIQVRTGDLDGNTKRILSAIDTAIEQGSDIVVFPETSVTGYACADMFLHNGFIAHQLEFVNKVIVPYTIGKKISVILGYVDKSGREKDGFPHLFNSACHIRNGQIVESYNKILLARRGQHDDVRYFEPGNRVLTFDIEKDEKKVKFSAVICQDIWNDEVMRDIVGECTGAGAKFVVVLNQSYFYFKKLQKRQKIVSNHCAHRKIPMFYVNAVGVGDIAKNIIIYDGASFACDQKGNILSQAMSFEEDVRAVEFNLEEADGKSIFQSRESLLKDEYTKEQKYNDIFNSLVFCVREFFESIGIKKPMVYLSGGIDSSVVACIVSAAFKNREDIVFVSSPTEDNGAVTKANAQHLADALNVPLLWVPMQKAYEGFIADYQGAFNEEPSPRSRSAYQAIGRTPQSIGIAHKFGSCANVGCSNQTENILGFSSLNDVANTCAIGLVNDLTKIEIFEMAKYINSRYLTEFIPSNLYSGDVKPSAELADNKGEDPYNYYLYSPICSVLIRFQMDILTIIDQFKNKTLNEDEFVVWPNGKTIYENITLEEFQKTVFHVFELSKRSVFKSAQAGPTPIISPFSRGFSSRETIINKYAGRYEFQESEKLAAHTLNANHFMALE